MLQPYGIDLAGDAAGSVLTLAVFLAVRAFRSPRAAFWTLAALSAVSAAGSASLLPVAIWRGDVLVAWYHAAWVVVSVALARWAWRRRLTAPAGGPLPST